MQLATHSGNPQDLIEQRYYEYFSQKKTVGKGNTGKKIADYTLPVVVHVVHGNGAENIPDAQVLQGIQDLNDAFANVGYYDPTTGVDTRLRFCLAIRDPDGNAASGIDRVQSPLTDLTLETDDIPMKNLSRWDPLSYINIWLVREICSISYGCSVAGYAYLPASHGQPEDGIVMEAKFFGSSQGASGVQVHEMGHYLGLYHTFQGGCTNYNCLTDGDRVCDTPPDASTTPVPCNATPNSCSTDANSGFASDQLDLFQDYMDYGDFDCWSVFTQGQTDRMHWHIENVRFSLLESQGCLDPCTSALSASFIANLTTVDVGGTVNFTNTSTNATSAAWTIDGAPFAISTNASYTFGSVGSFEICLKAGNDDPNCSNKFCQTITVTCPVSSNFTASSLYPNTGQPVTYTNTSANASMFQWKVNGVPQSGAANFTFSFPAAGAYSVCLLAGNGLCNREYCLPVLVSNPPLPPSECDTTFLKIYGTSQDDEIGKAIAKVPDALGGGYLIGGGKADSAMITLLDANANIVWTRAFDATPDADDFIWDISFDSDNNVVGSGQTKIDNTNNIECFVFKYNMVTNTILWINELDINDPAHEVYYSVFEKTPGGNYVVAGEVDQLFGSSGCNGIILEVNRNTGANVWQRTYTLGSCETFQRTILANNAIYTTGRYNLDNGGTARMRPGITKFDLNGNQQWSRLYLRAVNAATNARLYSTDIITDNGLVVTGMGDNDGTSTSDVELFLFKTDYDGDLQWAMNYDIPGASSEVATRLVNLPDGYLCLGYFSGTNQDVFIFKTDKQGQPLWSKSYGSPGLEDGVDMLWDNGLIYFTGKSDGIGSGSSEDLFLASLTPNGNPTSLDNCDLFHELPMTAAPYANPYEAQHNLTNLAQNFGNFLGTTVMGETAVQATFACAGPCAEVCDNELDDDGDGYVDCFDEECDCSPNDCVVNPNDLAQNFAAKLAWQSTTNEASVDATPIVANLNPQMDDIPEIIVIESKSSVTTQLSTDLIIYRGDGSNASNPGKLSIMGGYDAYPAVNPAVGDVDGNGIPELVMVSSERRIRVYSFYDENATVLMQEIVVSSDQADERNRKPYLADFDSDGMAEVYVGNDIFRFDAGMTSLTKVLDGGSSAGLLFYQNYQQPNCSPVAVDILSVAECNGDPDCAGLELVAGNVIYSIDLSTTDGDGFEIKIQRDLNLLQVQHIYLDGYTVVADVNLDGTLDVVVSSGRDNDEGVYVWDKDGLVAYFEHPPFVNQYRSGGLPCIANVYDDTQSGAVFDFPEIIVCSEFHLNCYNVNAATLGVPGKAWWNLPTTDASGATGATVFDFNGDGMEEIVYRDEDNLRIMYGGATPFPPGVDAQRNWFTYPAGSGTFDEHPTVADVDNDGQAEIAVTSYTFPGTNTPVADYRGRLRVFEADLAAGDPWMSARPIWNQYNYFVVNVDDDLGIPPQQQSHHLEFPFLGSEYRPFNRQVAQSPLLDNNFQPYLPVPDATVAVDSIGCGDNLLALWISVCNEGDALLPQGTPIAFYLGDPTATAATLHFLTTLEAGVAPGNCFSQIAIMPVVNNVDIFVVVNDDGSLPTPYDLATDFPVTGILECHYENNIGCVFVQYNSPTLNLGADTTMCQFGVVVLDAGAGFASYLWQDGSTDQIFTAFNPGTYWVLATDICGGIQSDTISISVDSTTVLDLGPDVVICSGESLTFIINGYETYDWLPGDYLSCKDCPNPSATPPVSITYTLVATTADGCIGLDSVHIEVFPGVETFDTLTICTGDTAIVFGNPVTTAGTFSQTYTLPNGCDSTHHVTVNVKLTIEVIEDRILCEGDTVLVFGMPVTATGQFSQVFTAANGCDSVHTVSVGLLETIYTYDTIFLCFGETADVFGTPTGTAGSYPMTFQASNTCDSVHTIELIVNDEISLSLSSGNVSCFGEANGSVTASATGGSDGFSYLWGGGQTGASLGSLPAGSYSLTVTDASGCTAEAGVSITQPAVLENTISSVNATCATPGSASISATGGTTPYTYAWSNGETTPSIGGLTAGTYSVTVSDANGCTAVSTATISGTLSPLAAISVNAPVTTAQPNGGALSVQTIGGMAPFSFAWSNGATAAAIANLSSGTYTVTVTDANGCTATSTAYLYLPACTGGIIWEDLDRDGCQDVNELGIEGIQLALSGTDIWGNPVTGTTVSGIFGDYIFENLPPGNYQLSLTIPPGYSVSPANACVDDFTDNDFNQNGVTIGSISLVEGHCCLIVAGGLYDACLNVIDPGTICCNQTLCGPGVAPSPITGTPATGAGGAVQYMWLFHVANGNWQTVLNASGQPVTTASLSPGPLSQTTWFRRCVKAVNCSTWLEGNIVKITVGNVAVADISGPDLVCVGKPATYTAAANPAGATYSWNFGSWSTPGTSNQPSATVTWNSTGVVFVKLNVTYGGCTSTDLLGVAITDSPSHCNNSSMAQGGTTVQTAPQQVTLSGGERFVVYPNPVEGVLRIAWNEAVETEVGIELLGTEGTLLHQATTAPGGKQYASDLSTLLPGMYLLRLRYNDGEQAVFKIVKM
jgi:hypothetical protein